jgi:hypothetical protein
MPFLPPWILPLQVCQNFFLPSVFYTYTVLPFVLMEVIICKYLLGSWISI